ncbi:MAG TPA: aspartate kinase [Pseudomonadota bacterium]|nr:aspartate kinase [Pseudomonadota bacterium]
MPISESAARAAQGAVMATEVGVAVGASGGGLPPVHLPERDEAELSPIVVQKYGGSSVASPERLRQVAARVAAAHRAGQRVVVVVSAMGKTTDELLSLAKSIAPSPPRRELDMLLSCGERISMALLAMALSELGVPAISFTGSQSGILTNDRHSGARIIEVRPVRIEDELARGYVVIVAGFQGMSYKREITTLGRGGSDTTAVALAAALGAAHCEIYSDVDGVYTADPRLVPDARHIPHLAYDEMQELAAHGAKVLNAQAVEWAQRAGIVIHARKTQPLPSGSAHGRETQIVARRPPGPNPADSEQGRPERLATAVTSTAQLIEISTPTHGRAVLAVLQSQGVSLRELSLDLPPGADSAGSMGQALRASFVRDDLPDFAHTLAQLSAAAQGSLSSCDAFGSVTAVGPGLGSSAPALLAVDADLAAAGLHVVRYRQSGLCLTIHLPSAEVATATRRVHDLLCRDSSSVSG